MCNALEVKQCEGCKFRKTQIEFLLAQADAEQHLKDNGLAAVRVGTGRDAIITTRAGECD